MLPADCRPLFYSHWGFLCTSQLLSLLHPYSIKRIARIPFQLSKVTIETVNKAWLRFMHPQSQLFAEESRIPAIPNCFFALNDLKKSTSLKARMVLSNISGSFFFSSGLFARINARAFLLRKILWLYGRDHWVLFNAWRLFFHLF